MHISQQLFWLNASVQILSQINIQIIRMIEIQGVHENRANYTINKKHNITFVKKITLISLIYYEQ